MVGGIFVISSLFILYHLSLLILQCTKFELETSIKISFGLQGYHGTQDLLHSSFQCYRYAKYLMVTYFIQICAQNNCRFWKYTNTTSLALRNVPSDELDDHCLPQMCAPFIVNVNVSNLLLCKGWSLFNQTLLRLSHARSSNQPWPCRQYEHWPQG